MNKLSDQDLSLKASFERPLLLESGRTLPRFEIGYETYGRLDPDASNAILICHNLTVNCHASGCEETDSPRPGWWDMAIGPGKPFDTSRYFVICSNVLGGSDGSTGPSSIDPETGRRYGMRFPVVTVRDMVTAQAHLADHLGIKRFHTIAGGCFGGFQVLQWLALFPERLSRAVVVGATPRTSAHNLALWEVMRHAIMQDARWRDGDYYDGEPPVAGHNLAHQIGLLIWMARGVMARRFGLRFVHGEGPGYTFSPEFEMQAFLQKISSSRQQGADPNSFLYLSRASDYFDLTRGGIELSQVFARVTSPVLLASYHSDWRYPPEEVEEIRQALRKLNVPVCHRVLESDFGHGAFIYDFENLGLTLKEFLADADGYIRLYQ